MSSDGSPRLAEESEDAVDRYGIDLRHGARSQGRDSILRSVRIGSGTLMSMTGPQHRGDPADKPTRAEKREYYRGITARAAARNGLSETEYKKYASMAGNDPHGLHRPTGLLVLALVITLGTAAILVTAAVQWFVNHVNIVASIWFIVLVLVGLCVWSWVYLVHEVRTARNRRNDSVTLLRQGHSSFDDGPDPGAPIG